MSQPGHFKSDLVYTPNDKTWDVNLPPHYYDFLTVGECEFHTEPNIRKRPLRLLFEPVTEDPVPYGYRRICRDCDFVRNQERLLKHADRGKR